MSALRLTQDQARGILYHGQRLIEPAATAKEAADALFVIQSQYPATLPVAIAARTPKFTFKEHEKALKKDKWIVKCWSVRSTLHAFTLENHAIQRDVIGALYRKWIWSQMSGYYGLDKVELFERRIMEELQSGPLTRAELHARIPELTQIENAGWGRDVRGLAYSGDLLFAHQGAAQSQFVRYDQWIPEPIAPDPNHTMGTLLRRYLRAYGPATLNDFRFFCGVYVPQAKAAFAELKDELVPVEVEGLKGTRYLLESQIPIVEARHTGVTLLPKFDQLVLAHNDKSLVFRNLDHRLVFRPAAQVEAVVVMDGHLKGTWRTVRKGESMVLQVFPFASVNKKLVKQIERPAARVAKALGFNNVDVEFV